MPRQLDISTILNGSAVASDANVIVLNWFLLTLKHKKVTYNPARRQETKDNYAIVLTDAESVQLDQGVIYSDKDDCWYVIDDNPLGQGSFGKVYNVSHKVITDVAKDQLILERIPAQRGLVVKILFDTEKKHIKPRALKQVWQLKERMNKQLIRNYSC